MSGGVREADEVVVLEVIEPGSSMFRQNWFTSGEVASSISTKRPLPE